MATRDRISGPAQILGQIHLHLGCGHGRSVFDPTRLAGFEVTDDMIVADGAAWIWNLAGDRFAGARQRVDFYHVSQHLWAVAHALHPDDEAAAKGWVQPMLDKLKEDASCEVITDLAQLRQRLEGSVQEQVAKEVNYLQTHRDRLDYGTAHQRGEPLGSGAMESTCRQYQARFKRTGQFWSQTGDEALMCLETFRRNGRWHVLFPHSKADPSKN